MLYVQMIAVKVLERIMLVMAACHGCLSWLLVMAAPKETADDHAPPNISISISISMYV
jgi:hypothetical protein